jgi:hypothetical protein
MRGCLHCARSSNFRPKYDALDDGADERASRPLDDLDPLCGSQFGEVREGNYRVDAQHHRQSAGEPFERGGIDLALKWLQGFGDPPDAITGTPDSCLGVKG